MASVAALCRLYGADMVHAAAGSILITSSLTALQPLPGAALYGASRAFVHSLAGGLAAELAPHGVHVRCLLPGSTDTEFSSRSQLQQSLAFNGPLFRPLGVVSTSAEVAYAALNAIESGPSGSVEVVPSFMQRVYATSARAILPRARAGGFASLFFGPISPLTSFSAFAAALPTLLVAVPAVLVAIPITLVQEVLYALPAPLFYLLLLLLVLVGINIAQNGLTQPGVPAPTGLTTAALVRTTVRTKAELVALWKAGKAPARRTYAGLDFEAAVLPLGILAPISAFITHCLFPGFGRGGPWTGKGFDAGGDGGLNHFGGGGRPAYRLRPFRATIGPSWYDGRSALVLDYAAGGSFFWGRVLGMRDELREVAPGVLVGLGSMAATGGMRNSAPFVLWRP